MATGKRASGTLVTRDFRDALADTGIAPSAEYDPGSVGNDEFSDDLALANTLAQIGEDESNAKVYVYKIDSKTQKDAFAFETSPAEFAIGGLTEIGKRYGGGEYRIRVYADGKILTHKRISIMEQKENMNTAPVFNPTELHGLFAQQQAAMMEGFKLLAESMRANQPPPTNRMEFLQEISAMRNLFASDNKQSGPGISEMLDILKQGMDLGRSGGEQSMLDVLMRGIETFGPVITEAVKNGAVAQNTQAPMQNASIAALPNPAPQMQQQTSEDEMGMLRDAMLKQSLNFLVKQAQAENDPEIYAVMVADQLDDETLSAFAQRQDWAEFLTQYNPEIATPAIRAWFDKLRTVLIEILTAEPESGISPNHASDKRDNEQQPAIAADGNPERQSGSH